MNNNKTELFLDSPVLTSNIIFSFIFFILALSLFVTLSPVLSYPFLDALDPYLIKGALFTTEVKYIIFLIFIQTLILGSLHYLFPQKKKLIYMIFVLLSIILISLYIISWIQYKYFHGFLNIDSIQMFLYQPEQMLLHARDMLGNTLLVISLGLIVFITGLFFLIKTAFILKSNTRKIINISGIIFFLALILYNSYSTAQISRSKIQIQDKYHRIMLLKDYLKAFNINSIAPLTTFREDILNYSSSSQLIANKNSHVHYDKKIDMQTYLSKVEPKKIKKYNVILIEIESLRRDQLKIYGDVKGVMPNISKLAEQSWVFMNAYTQASHSNYADLAPLTSQYPLRLKRTYFYLEQSPYPRLTLYDILKHSGYRTAVISSQNENWGGMSNYLNTGNLDYFVHADNYKGQHLIEPDIKGMTSFDWNINTSTAGKIEDSNTLTIAKKWIQSLPETQNFFLYTNLQNSHSPFYYPDKLNRKFLTDKTAEADRFRNRDIPAKLNKNYYIQAYSDSLHYIDQLVGEFIQFLKTSGHWDNTILIITADTATQLSGSLLGNGGSLWKEVIQVPLIIKVPDMPRKIDNRLIQHIDITPTILGLLGLPAHPAFQGLNFSLSEEVHNPYIYLIAQTPSAYEYGIANQNWLLTYDVKTQQSKIEPLNANNKKPSPDSNKKMAEALSIWVSSQLDYYHNKHLYQNYYPPKYQITNYPEESMH